MSNEKKIYRYPGVRPFETEDKELFFGRDRDIEDLHNLIMLEKLVVLFGKSGYGKSSLLKAGILPKLAENQIDDEEEPYTILTIRLGAFSVGKSSESGGMIQNRSNSPLTAVRLKLDEKRKPLAENHFLSEILVERSLWQEFKCRQQGANHRRYVLFFDQFEEFFSYPIVEQIAFKKELATLLYETIPQEVRDAAANLSRANRVWLAKHLEVKVVFAIRSDRMSLLDSLKDELPAILHKRYELKALNAEQAKEAILKPASLRGERFISPPFEYSPKAIEQIIDSLSADDHTANTKKQGIEAFQLQLLCQDIEDKVLKGKILDVDANGLPDITPEVLPVMEHLYEDYYYRKLNELPENERYAAQLVLEDGLLAEDSATGEARRMSVDSNALLAQFRGKGLTQDLLIALANTFLIRAETNTVGGVSYEISHDTLLSPIQKTKTLRKNEEEKALLAQKAQAEKQEKELVQRQLRRVRSLLTVAVVALLIAGLSLWQAKTATQQANTSADMARKSAEKAKANELKAEQEKKTAEMQKSIAQKEQKTSDSLGKHSNMLFLQSESMRKDIENQKNTIAQAQKKTQNALNETELQRKAATEALQKAQDEQRARQIAENKNIAAQVEDIKALLKISDANTAKELLKKTLQNATSMGISYPELDSLKVQLQF